jgi:hypothetical protein
MSALRIKAIGSRPTDGNFAVWKLHRAVEREPALRIRRLCSEVIDEITKTIGWSGRVDSNHRPPGPEPWDTRLCTLLQLVANHRDSPVFLLFSMTSRVSGLHWLASRCGLSLHEKGKKRARQVKSLIPGEQPAPIKAFATKTTRRPDCARPFVELLHSLFYRADEICENDRCTLSSRNCRTHADTACCPATTRSRSSSSSSSSVYTLRLPQVCFVPSPVTAGWNNNGDRKSTASISA